MIKSKQKEYILNGHRDALELMDSDVPDGAVLFIEKAGLSVQYMGESEYVLTQESYDKLMRVGRQLKTSCKIHSKGRINFISRIIYINDAEVKESGYGGWSPFLESTLTYYDEKNKYNIFFMLWIKFDKDFNIAYDGDKSNKRIFCAHMPLFAPVRGIRRCSAIAEAIRAICVQGEALSKMENYTEYWLESSAEENGSETENKLSDTKIQEILYGS